MPASSLLCSAQIGVGDFTAVAAPAIKVRIIQELQQSRKRVALIGDGVNDAPTLAQADLGIALGTGAGIAMSAAPVVLVSGSLARVEAAFRLAAKTTRVVRQNLFWAFIYNSLGITLALTGVLTPSSPRPPCCCPARRLWPTPCASPIRKKGKHGAYGAQPAM